MIDIRQAQILFSLTLLILFFLSSVEAGIPANLDVNINNNAVYSKNAVVTLNIFATDANQMQFSCNGSNFSALENYATTTTFNLTTLSTGCNSSDGLKTVYFRAFNLDGNYSTQDATAQITLDRLNPIISNNSPANGLNTSNKRIPITASISDSTSDVNTSTILVKIAGNNFTTSSSEISYSNGTLTFTPSNDFNEGSISVSIDVNDKAGNSATQSVFSFTVDSIAPNDVTGVSAIDLSNGSDVNVSWSVVSDANQYKIYYSTSSITSVSGLTATKIISSGTTLSTVSGLDFNTKYYFAVTAIDLAGNEDKNVSSTANLTVNDTNAPAAVNAPTLSEACNASIKLTWTPNTDAGKINYYKIYRDFDSSVDLNGQTNIGKFSHNNCSSTSCVYTDSNALGNGTNYFYKLSAVDLAGNEGPINSGDKNATPIVCTGPGNVSVSSSTHPTETNWYAVNDVNVSWSAVSGATGYSYLLDQSSGTTADETSEGTNLNTSYSGKADGTYYFHIRAFNGVLWGSTTHFTINIDKTSPGIPDGFNGSSDSSGKVTLSWNTSSDLSGISKYELYRSTNPDFNADSSNKIADATSNSYTETLSNGTYYYKIKAIDKAGNASNTSDKISVSVTTPTSNNSPTITQCSLTLSTDLPEYLNQGIKTVTVNSSGGSLSNTTIQVKFFGEKYLTIKKDLNGASITVDINSIDKNTGEAEFYIIGLDSAKASCNLKKNFSLDKEKPSIKWLSPSINASLKNSVELKVEAFDSLSGVKEVEFYYNNTKIGSSSLSDKNEFKFSWNLNNLDSGEYTLKAIVKDKAENIEEKTLKVRIEGKTKVEEKVIKTQSYDFNKDLTQKLVEEVLKDKGLIEEAVKLLEKNNVARKLNLIDLNEVSDENKALFKVQIELNFTNDSNADQNIQLIEVIPKELTEKAIQIESDYNFEIIEDDPVIKFNLENVKAGETIKVSYSLKEKITEEKKKSLIEEKVIEKFKSPPILLNKETSVSKDQLKETLNPTALITVSEFNPFDILLGLVLIALILGVIGGGYYAYSNPKQVTEFTASMSKTVKTNLEALSPKTDSQKRKSFELKEKKVKKPIRIFEDLKKVIQKKN